MHIFVGYSCSISSTRKYDASQLPWNETTSLIWLLGHNNSPLRGSYDGFLARDEMTFVFLVKHLALTKSDMPSHHLSCSIVHSAFLSLSLPRCPLSRNNRVSTHILDFSLSIPFVQEIHIFIQRSPMATESCWEPYSVTLCHTVYPGGCWCVMDGLM